MCANISTAAKGGFVFAVLLLSSFSNVGQTADLAICNTSSITQKVDPKDNSEFPILALEMSFEPMQVQVISPAGFKFTNDVFLPSISMRLDASKILDQSLEGARAAAEQIPSSAGSVSSVYIRNWNVVGRELIVNGSVDIEKWASMDGWGCDGHDFQITCGPKTWKIKLWEHTFDWSNTLALETYMRPAEEVSSNKPSPTLLSSVMRPDFRIQGEGKVDAHISNDIKRFFADFATALSTFKTLHLEHLISGDIIKNEKTFDTRATFYQDEADTLYRIRGGVYSKKGSRGLWSIFSDTLEVNIQKSQFQRADKLQLLLVLTQDNLKFGTLLKSSDDRNAVDWFSQRDYCSNQEFIRGEMTKYLRRIADKIGKEPTPVVFTGSWSELKSQSYDYIGNPDAATFLLSQKTVNKLSDGTYHGILPSVDALGRGAMFVRAWDNIDTIASFYSADTYERKCLHKLAKKKHGNVNLIYPMDDVGVCLPVSVKVNARQSAIADKSLLNSININALAETLVPASPVDRPIYRGWYYCYRNTTMCAGKDNVMWWQDASRFNARAGRHLGIDIFGDDRLGGSDIYAVASGVLSYSANDLSNWGHAVTLPFTRNGETLLAVYAHLPPSAKELHGRAIKQGALFGVTGCSGNSGDGAGKCNTYCTYAGSPRTDEHLHFEVLKKTTTGWEKVNPLLYIPLVVENSSQRFIARCDSTTNRKIR
jgi:hypothetical protein